MHVICTRLRTGHLSVHAGYDHQFYLCIIIIIISVVCVVVVVVVIIIMIHSSSSINIVNIIIIAVVVVVIVVVVIIVIIIIMILVTIFNFYLRGAAREVVEADPSQLWTAESHALSSLRAQTVSSSDTDGLPTV